MNTWIEKHADKPGFLLLMHVSDSCPVRSIERDILISALLYIAGETEPGNTVARWWGGIPRLRVTLRGAFRSIWSAAQSRARGRR